MVRYVFGPGRAEEHLSPRVIAGNIAAADERAVREGLGAQAQLRADRGCAWVTVRHDDVQRDGREHVHLLAIAVTGAGERWDDSLDRPRAIAVCRAIEAERGLVVADAPERRAGRDARTA